MTIQTCDRCSENWCDECQPDEAREVDGDTWCESCTDRHAWYCEHCETYHSASVSSYSCDACGLTYCEENDNCEYVNGGTYCCSDCVPEGEEEEEEPEGAEPDRMAVADYHGTNICYPATKNAIGIELELNFERSQRVAVLEAFNSKIKGIEYHWERDGSIGEGAELITHPATYDTIRESGLRDALQDAWKAGARGYVSGKCGLHVHISRDQLPEDLSLLKQFMLLNQAKIESFAARKGNTYSQFPASVDSSDWVRSKYVCLNFQHENSVEFRVFRSTTNYERIRASIEFCAGLCEYLKSLSAYKLQKNPGCLHYWGFTRWVEESGRYPHLKERLLLCGWNDQSESVETEFVANQ